jgi:DNA repair exonuclease SbcCD ATPase subunit
MLLYTVDGRILDTSLKQKDDKKSKKYICNNSNKQVKSTIEHFATDTEIVPHPFWVAVDFNNKHEWITDIGVFISVLKGIYDVIYNGLKNVKESEKTISDIRKALEAKPDSNSVPQAKTDAPLTEEDKAKFEQLKERAEKAQEEEKRAKEEQRESMKKDTRNAIVTNVEYAKFLRTNFDKGKAIIKKIGQNIETVLGLMEKVKQKKVWLQNENARMDAENTDLANKINTAENDITSSNNRIKSKKSDIDNYNNLIIQERLTYNMFNSTIKDVIIQKYQLQIDTLNNEIKSLIDRILELQKQIEKFKANIQSNKNDIAYNERRFIEFTNMQIWDNLLHQQIDIMKKEIDKVNGKIIPYIENETSNYYNKAQAVVEQIDQL